MRTRSRLRPPVAIPQIGVPALPRAARPERARVDEVDARICRPCDEAIPVEGGALARRWLACGNGPPRCGAGPLVRGLEADRRVEDLGPLHRAERRTVRVLLLVSARGARDGLLVDGEDRA